MLQRIYGTAWQTKEQVSALSVVAVAPRRRHRLPRRARGLPPLDHSCPARIGCSWKRIGASMRRLRCATTGGSGLSLICSGVAQAACSVHASLVGRSDDGPRGLPPVGQPRAYARASLTRASCPLAAASTSRAAAAWCSGTPREPW